MSDICPEHGCQEFFCRELHDPNAFVCPRCEAVSHNPHDIAEGYCGKCHDWTRNG